MRKSLDNPTNPSESKNLPKQKEQRVYKIVVDRELCIGAANCLALAPEAFELDGENIAVIIENWDHAADEALIQAAESCPVKAITLFDKNGKQIYP